MKWKRKNHSADTPFSFFLLLIFTMFTMILAGTGAAVYQNSAAHLNENYTSRTAIAYIFEKVRQHNSKAAIFLSDVEGTDALVLSESIEEEAYLTYIYYYDHALCELFVHENTEPKLQSGSRIIELENLTIEPLETAASTNEPQTNESLANEASTNEPPTAESSAAESSATEPPTAESPATEPPTAESPTAEPPAAEPSAAESSAASTVTFPHMIRVTAVSPDGNTLSALIRTEP